MWDCISGKKSLITDILQRRIFKFKFDISFGLILVLAFFLSDPIRADFLLHSFLEALSILASPLIGIKLLIWGRGEPSVPRLSRFLVADNFVCKSSGSFILNDLPNFFFWFCDHHLPELAPDAVVRFVLENGQLWDPLPAVFVLRSSLH